MRYVDNPNLKCVELADFLGAVDVWRKAQHVPCYPRSASIDHSVAAARHIADSYPHLAPDLVRLTNSRNLLLAFFAYLTLLWMKAEEAATCREYLGARSFPVFVGSFRSYFSLDAAVDAAERHCKSQR